MKQRIILITALAIVGMLCGALWSIARAQTVYLPAVMGEGVASRTAPATATPTTTQESVVNPTATPTSTSTSTPTSSASDCPTDAFIDVQQNPANSAYPAPQLNVTCTATEVIIETNNIPEFEFVQTTPNQLQAQDFTLRLPLQPTWSSVTTTVPLVGASAIAVDGLVVFGPTEAPRDGSRDPYLDNILDYCNGHTAPGGIYHFHARPDCLFPDLDQAIPENVGRVLAYAFDGYPILAPYVCEDEACTSIKKVRSSWWDAHPDLANAWERHEYVAGLGDLDECNGMTQPDGSYAYYATDTFPYFMGCYHGVVTQQNIGGGGPPR